MDAHFPLQSWINSLSYQKKYWIIACTFMFTALFIGTLLHLEQERQIKKVENQIRGIEYYRGILTLSQDERLYRFYSSDPENFKEDYFQLERGVQEHFENLIELTKANERALKLSFQDLEAAGITDLHVKNLKRQWQEVQRLHRGVDYDRFHLRLKDLADYIIETAHLTSLQDLELSFLMDSVFYEVQEVSERFDQCVDLLGKKQSPISVETVLKAHLGTVESSLRKAYNHNQPRIRKQTEGPLHDYLTLMHSMSELIIKGEGQEVARNYVIVCKETEKFAKELLDTMDTLLKESLYELKSSYAIDFTLGAFMLAIAIFLGFYFEAGIRKPLKDLERAAKEFGEGNLASRAIISTHDGIGRVGEAFNEMAASIQNFIEKVKKANAELQAASGEVSDIAKRQKEVFSMQNDACSKISKTATTIISSTKKFSATLEQFAAKAKVAKTGADDGKFSLQKVEKSLKKMVDDLAKMAASRKSTLGQVSELSQVASALNKVSDEVNLLSLNAAIESEKSGQSNKGFTLISQAITKLAGETASTTANITRLISEIQSAVGQTVADATGVADHISADIGELGRIERLFEAILGSIDLVLVQFQAVYGELTAQEQCSQEIDTNLSTLQASLLATTEAVGQFVSAMGRLKQISTEINS